MSDIRFIFKQYIKNNPLILSIVFFLSGIFLARAVSGLMVGKYLACQMILLSFVILLLIFSRRRRYFGFLACLFFFFLGVFRYSSGTALRESDISVYSTEEPVEVTLQGTVAGDPEWRGFFYARHQSFPLKTERILTKSEEVDVTGIVQVNLFSESERPKMGDKIVIGGSLSLPSGRTNPGGFDYKSYLKKRGIKTILYSNDNDLYLKTGVVHTPFIFIRRSIYDIRERADRILNRYLSEDARAVMRSIVLGRRGGISGRLQDIFIKTGTMHIFAVSGLHIGIVALLFMGIFNSLGCSKRVSCWMTIVGICLFAVFAGGRSSSIRAAFMGSFILANLSIGRKTNIVNSLFLSAFLITFFYPEQLFQPGFILSYIAVLSVIFITPLTDTTFGMDNMKYIKGRVYTIRKYMLKSLSVSFSVWIGMMPIIASYFQIITPSAVIANILAIPALFVMVFLGFGLMLTGSINLLSSIAACVSFFIEGVCLFFIGALRLIADVPFSFIRLPSPGLFLVWIYYVCLAGIIVLFHLRKKYRMLVPIFLLFGANLFLWNEMSHDRTDTFKVTFFDVNKADASVIEFGNKGVLMIDGGSGGKGTGHDAGRRVLAPYLWEKGVRRIDCVLLTHPHEDHIGGLLYILRNFDVKTVIENNITGKREKAGALYEEFKKIIKQKGIHYLKVRRGDIIEGFPDACFIVLNPPRIGSYKDMNNDSIVIKAVTKEGKSVLFCADIGSIAMKDILRFGSLLESNVIKVSHHGGALGDEDIVREFLRRVKYSRAVISTGKRSKVDKDLLKYLGEHGKDVYVTGAEGAVIVEEVDGAFKVRAFRDQTIFLL